MIKVMVLGLVLIVNRVLAILGRAVGMVIGGIVIGFVQGIKDIEDAKKYLKYQYHMAKKQIEQENEDNDHK